MYIHFIKVPHSMKKMNWIEVV